MEMPRARDAYRTNVALPPTTLEVPEADSMIPGVEIFCHLRLERKSVSISAGFNEKSPVSGRIHT